MAGTDSPPSGSPPASPDRSRLVRAAAVLAAIAILAVAGAAITGRASSPTPTPTMTAVTVAPPSSPSPTPAATGTPIGSPTGAAAATTVSGRPAPDPWEYCAAMGTIDRPEARVLGDGTRAMIQDALAIAEQRPQRFADPAARLVAIPWRCMNGVVWACDPGANLPCGAANTSREPTAGMRDYCREHPDGVLPAYVTGHETIYAWSCRAGAPAVDRQPFTVDERGFVANFWYRLDRPR